MYEAVEPAVNPFANVGETNGQDQVSEHAGESVAVMVNEHPVGIWVEEVFLDTCCCKALLMTVRMMQNCHIFPK